MSIFTYIYNFFKQLEETVLSFFGYHNSNIISIVKKDLATIDEIIEILEPRGKVYSSLMKFISLTENLKSVFDRNVIKCAQETLITKEEAGKLAACLDVANAKSISFTEKTEVLSSCLKIEGQLIIDLAERSCEFAECIGNLMYNSHVEL